MKPTTQALIESFRARRIAYLNRRVGNELSRRFAADRLRGWREMLGRQGAVEMNIEASEFRQHLASYAC